MAKHPYKGPWLKVRLAILERDGYVCQIKGPRCTRRATEVDHIVELAAGGLWLDPSNLRAACKSCNCARLGRSTETLTASRAW